MQDLEVVSVWFLCNIIFMFILFFFFFPLVDYIQDTSWQTDGDAFTRAFFSLFLLKKKKTSQGREGVRTGTAVDEGTESAHWPLGDMKYWEETPAHGLKREKKKVIIINVPCYQ